MRSASKCWQSCSKRLTISMRPHEQALLTQPWLHQQQQISNSAQHISVQTAVLSLIWRLLRRGAITTHGHAWLHKNFVSYSSATSTLSFHATGWESREAGNNRYRVFFKQGKSLQHHWARRRGWTRYISRSHRDDRLSLRLCGCWVLARHEHTLNSWSAQRSTHEVCNRRDALGRIGFARKSIQTGDALSAHAGHAVGGH